MATIPSTGSTILDIVLGAIPLLLIFLITPARQIPKGVRLPPGPRGKPILGNVSDMPTHHEWETLSQWAKEYGDLVYVKVLGQPIVFVNSLDVAYDLFEKRSSIYNDRPDFPFLMLAGWELNFGFMKYGHQWRRHREMFHQKFRPAVLAAYHPVQTKHARALLQRLHESPNNFTEHLRHFAGAIIMEVVYGIKLLPKSDPYIEIAEAALAGAAEAAVPGAFLVDMLPILRYVPEWMPGAGFQRKARIWREPTMAMFVEPFKAVKEALHTGTAQPSVTASLLEELAHQTDAPPDEEEIIRNTAGMAYTGGADTIMLILTTFMLAMVMFPEAQKKAQVELDSVLGTRSLPEFEDRENLPYVNALWKEVQRWHPVTPAGGIPHRLMQDDIYGKYIIPKGSIVVGNSWVMLHDEKTYGPRTDEFNPDRFLVPGVPDPTAFFGFGRRMCPGRHMADDSAFIAVASILKIYQISLARDAMGNEIPVTESFTSGAMVGPELFKCEIKPRSAVAEGLILEHVYD